MHGPLQVVDAHRVKDDTGLEAHREVAQASEEIVVLPARYEVNIGFDLVDLDAAPKGDLAEARRLDLDRERDHRMLGRRLRQRGHDVHGAEDVEVEQRLGRRVDLGRGVGGPFPDVDGAPERGLRDLLRAGARGVRVEAGDGDGPEGRDRTRDDPERVVGARHAEVDLRLRVRGRVRVPAVGERFLHEALGGLELVLVEALPRGDRGPGGLEDGLRMTPPEAKLPRRRPPPRPCGSSSAGPRRPPPARARAGRSPGRRAPPARARRRSPWTGRSARPGPCRAGGPPRRRWRSRRRPPGRGRGTSTTRPWPCCWPRRSP